MENEKYRLSEDIPILNGWEIKTGTEIYTEQVKEKTYKEVWNKWQEEINDYNFAEWLYNKAYPNETTD